jgi:hypothetical protein
MNDPSGRGLSKDTASSGEAVSAEATLRLIASLPPPKGLEDRVRAGLAAAPRRGRILAWPAALKPQSAWMRSAAAAAIVFVVVGGGWGVYSRVQRTQPARVIVLAPRGPAQGGFASAGAMRTPQTLNGPVVAHPAAQPAESQASGKGAAPIAKDVRKPLRRASAASETRIHAAAQPAK